MKREGAVKSDTKKGRRGNKRKRSRTKRERRLKRGLAGVHRKERAGRFGNIKRQQPAS